MIKIEECKEVLDRLRIVRKKIGITQAEFARRIGLTQTSMSMIQSGKSNLTDKNIKLMCITYSINEAWLLTGGGGMFVSPSPYEKELLDIFRKLDDADQEFLLETTQNLLKRQKKALAKRLPPDVQ
jgi:transcriptional regulator with XRE-family HTH domain